MSDESAWRRRPISYALERHALATRRFAAEPTAPHRDELRLARRSVRDALTAGAPPTREEVASAHRAAAMTRSWDLQYQMCRCNACAAPRNALVAYTKGFQDGALGRVGRRRLSEYLQPFKKHFKIGLQDGLRVRNEHITAYQEKVSKEQR